MVDSTGHQHRLDPEQFAALLKNYLQLVFDCARTHGGYVARVVGDGVLVFFGWPAATGKDAQAAVTCALDIAARMARYFSDPPMAVRLAVETGWVLVGDTATPNAPRRDVDHATVIGSAANIAARLQQAARPNGVIVGQGTLALLDGRFVLERTDTSRLRLPFPQAAAHVLGDPWQDDPLGWLVRRFDRAGKALFGREGLFQDLLSRWAKARDGDGQAVLLTGDAGIGKSHLLAALLHASAADDPAVISLYCTISAGDSALHPVVDWLRRRIGIDAAAFPGDIRAATSRYAAGLGLDGAVAGPALAMLLGAAPDDAQNREQMRRQVFDVLADILQQAAGGRPLLVLIEDLHWADPSTQELIGRLVHLAGCRRIMLVATSRLAAAPGFADLSHVTRLHLRPLPAGAALQLADTVATRFGVTLSASARAAILARADGVALFIEEFVRSIAQDSATADRPPGTIGQLLASRLDALDTARPLAQMAAILGQEAPLALLADLSELPADAFDAGITRLIDRGVMLRRGAGPRASLVFRHALLAEAAYATMTKSRRAALHLRVAALLRRDNPALATTAPAIMAHHLAEAGETRQAAPLFAAAARGMLDSGSYTEAEAQSRRALACFDTNADAKTTLSALMPLGEALIGARGYADPEVRQVFERGAGLATTTEAAPALLSALRGLTSYYQVRGPMARANELSGLVFRIARSIGDTVAMCQAEQRHGWCLMCQGRLTEAAAAMESALARHRMMDAALRQRDFEDRGILAHLAWLDGLMVGPDAMVRRAALATQRLDGLRPLQVAYILAFAGIAHQLADDPAETARFAAQSSAVARQHALPYWMAMSDALAGWAAVARGDQDGLRLLRDGVAAYERTQAQVLLPYLLGLLAEAEHARGDPAAALAALQRADLVVTEIGADLYRAPLLRLWSRLVPGQEKAAMLREAKRVADGQGAQAFARLVADDLAATAAPPRLVSAGL